MADEDEIDILGDFSFNSCLAQNSQGIPSCSDNEDTVHPQWLLDSTANNWYDNRNKDSVKPGSSRMLSGNRVRKFSKTIHDMHTAWTSQERALLGREMEKYGRNIKKISQIITSKTEAEIQAQIDAEYGIQLETPPAGLDKIQNDQEDVPSMVQEEIVTDNDVTNNIKDVINMVTTGSPTILIPKKKVFNKKNSHRHHNSILKPEFLGAIKQNSHDLINVNPAEIFYDDDLMIGSTESVGQDIDTLDSVSKKLPKNHKPDTKMKPKFTKKIGNHRRKVSRNFDKGARPRNSSKDNLRSPQNRQRKNTSLSEDATKSPKLQIVLGSGQALPVSEGEQVIKIEKKKESESDSDIEVDSEEDRPSRPAEPAPSMVHDDTPVAVPLRKFEPMPRRQKKINLDGEGGYTIMHTASGDLYEMRAEPKRERAPRRQHVSLIQCRLYNAERPAPFAVRLHVSALILMDAQAHTSRGEVMGLVGGALHGGTLRLEAYRPAAASSSRTHCDMDPVSQAAASSWLLAAGWRVSGWHHSHPAFPPAPSATDLRSQAALQAALERPRAPLVGLITSQHWPPGRSASQYRCIRVEPSPDSADSAPCGFQLSVSLVADLTRARAPAFLRELRAVLAPPEGGARGASAGHAVRMASDVCPQANLTYLEKCISSVSQHLRSAGYSPDDPVVSDVIEGLRDIFR